MKIVKIIGGLGNQMFQYAFAEELKHLYPQETVKLDISLFGSYTLHKLEVFKVFSLPQNAASAEEISRISRNFKNYKIQRLCRKLLPPLKTEVIEPKDDRFNVRYLEKAGDAYYEGYWQNYRYFDDIKESIKNLYAFPAFKSAETQNMETAERMKAVNSVGIHVRRGNYLKHKMYSGICDEVYYKKAIEYISSRTKDPEWFIFSNDIAWCRDYFSTLVSEDRLHFVDWNKDESSFRDMHLMTLCRHLILANSSFSWWAAYLSRNIVEDQLILAPVHWLNGIQAKEIHCPSWIKI